MTDDVAGCVVKKRQLLHHPLTRHGVPFWTWFYTCLTLAQDFKNEWGNRYTMVGQQVHYVVQIHRSEHKHVD